MSPGCAHCYALDSAASLKRREGGRVRKARAEGKPDPTVRYQRDGDPKTSGPGFGFTVHWDKLQNFHFPAGARVFVNSMSDVFHEEAPLDAIAQLWAAFSCKPNVKWLVLTKRPERMLEVLTSKEWRGMYVEAKVNLARHHKVKPSLEWPLPNVWLGVTVENRRFVRRADLLRQAPAAVRFISAEPLLGPLIHDFNAQMTSKWHDDFEGPELDLTEIDWLIAGGESGPNHRPIEDWWVRDLRVEASMHGTAFFFKQWGGKNAKEGGRELDGRTWDEFPTVPVPA